jgi:hypothetical protein
MNMSGGISYVNKKLHKNDMSFLYRLRNGETNDCARRVLNWLCNPRVGDGAGFSFPGADARVEPAFNKTVASRCSRFGVEESAGGPPAAGRARNRALPTARSQAA